MMATCPSGSPLDNPWLKSMIYTHQAGPAEQREPEAMEETKPHTEESESVTRPQAIELLRRKLEHLPKEGECLCAAAGRYGIFCGGFRKLSDQEFRSRFDWIAGKRPAASRAELENLVSLYHIGRQEVHGARLCCDVETREHCACDGWNAFDNAELERLCFEIARRRVRIV